jgi:hypothetical protein
MITEQRMKKEYYIESIFDIIVMMFSWILDSSYKFKSCLHIDSTLSVAGPPAIHDLLIGVIDLLFQIRVILA